MAASWFGLFEMLPGGGRLALLLVFVAGVAAACLPLLRLKAPAEPEILARLDHAADAPHRPVSALRDRMAQGDDDPVAQALWRAHRRAILARIGRLRLGLPKPGLARIDRLALRTAAPRLPWSSAFSLPATSACPASSPPSWLRSKAVASMPVRIDAWVTPPLYTRRPPQTLATASSESVSVPQNSLLVVRVAGDDKAVVSASNEAARFADRPHPRRRRPPATRRRLP